MRRRFKFIKRIGSLSSTLTSTGLEFHSLGRLDLDLFTGAWVNAGTSSAFHDGEGAKAD